MAGNGLTPVARSLQTQVAAKSPSVKQVGNWFGKQGQKADMAQLKQLRTQYGHLGDITLDPIGKAWVLPAGATNPGLASINGRPAVPTASSQLRLQ